MGFAYLANEIEVKASLRVQAGVSTSQNGTGVDIGDYEGPILVVVDGPVASASDTVTFTVEHSESSGSGYTAVSASALVDPSTGDADTFTQITDAVAVFETLALKREALKRYVRIVATLAGGTISVAFAGYIIGQKKNT